MSTVAAKAAQISNFAPVELLISLRLETFPTRTALEAPGRGKSSIKRTAIVLESACVHRSPGNCAINEANLCTAGLFGSADSSAAIAQGSTFRRASAERTLSGISSLSVPMGAYRKSSYSGLKNESDAAGTDDHYEPLRVRFTQEARQYVGHRVLRSLFSCR